MESISHEETYTFASGAEEAERERAAWVRVQQIAFGKALTKLGDDDWEMVGVGAYGPAAFYTYPQSAGEARDALYFKRRKRR